jgi:hypothetical protein
MNVLIPMYPTSSFVLISESLRETRGFALHRTTVLASSLAVVMALVERPAIQRAKLLWQSLPQ